MDKKSVLIIGGSSGIGLAAAKLFAKKDYLVFNASRTACYVQGVTNFKLDVTEDDVLGVVGEVVKIAGKIDVLVYSAGFSMASPLEKAESRDVKELYQINVFGAMEAAKAAIGYMRESGGGRIIFVSSIGGVVPIKYDCFYSSSKSAVDMLSYCLRLELEKFNVYTTSIQPGGTVTPFSYRRQIYPDDKVFPYRISDAVEALLNVEQKGNAPEVVAREIYRTVERKNPPIVAAAGMKNKAIRMIAKFCPKKLMLPLLKKAYKT